MNEQESKRVAEQLYETFNSGDVEGFLNLFSEDAHWNSPDIENVPLESNVTGRDKIGEFITKIDEFEEFLKIEPKEFITQGSKVVVLGELEVRSKITEKQYNTGFAHIIEVRDGKAISFLEYFDNAAAGRAHSAARAA
ncbi:MAG: nuclear transport factor 2 family protein [Pyrinomonadaceae bacterium]|nr:nuclear transport factor 2 family protein [Pyrinomonadaceae bacterium]